MNNVPRGRRRRDSFRLTLRYPHNPTGGDRTYFRKIDFQSLNVNLQNNRVSPIQQVGKPTVSRENHWTYNDMCVCIIVVYFSNLRKVDITKKTSRHLHRLQLLYMDSYYFFIIHNKRVLTRPSLGETDEQWIPKQTSGKR